MQLIETIELQYLAPLPVELVYFRAKRTGDNVTLNWRTASEKNNKHFEIQRSTDGRVFTTIGVVTGKGNSNITTDYTYADNKATSGLSYYRLKQVDFDNTFDYSSVVYIDIENTNTRAVTAVPNPFTASIVISFTANTDEQVTLFIIDIAGKTEMAQAIQAETGKNEVALNLSHLNSSMYILQIYGKVTQLTERLVKQ